MCRCADGGSRTVICGWLWFTKEMVVNAKLVLLQTMLLVLGALGSGEICGAVHADSREPAAGEDFFEMSIEELMEVEIESTASLTGTSARLAPAAVTTITQDQILASGARSLFELLDIYVPNLQWIRHHWQSDHLGLRGIMGERDDEYLLLVNGRVMNKRNFYGWTSDYRSHASGIALWLMYRF